MLIAYLQQLSDSQISLLQSWTLSRVSFWPRSYSSLDAYNSAIPQDWWLLFASHRYADLWLIQYGEYSRIIRTLRECSHPEFQPPGELWLYNTST